jgi:hypothetical protein
MKVLGRAIIPGVKTVGVDSKNKGIALKIRDLPVISDSSILISVTGAAVVYNESETRPIQRSKLTE